MNYATATLRFWTVCGFVALASATASAQMPADWKAIVAASRLMDCPSPRSTRSATLGGNKSQSNSRAKSTGAIG